MKHITILIVSSFCLFLCGCEPWASEHLGRTIVEFKNNAEYEVSVYSVMLPPYDFDSSVLLYPDTNLPIQMPKVEDIIQQGFGCIYDSRTDLAYIYSQYKSDTISLFVFSTKQLSSMHWDSIRTNYSILQRYDIGLHEFDLLNYHLTFPPTYVMRNIKMWPPYGTYDSLGHPNN